MTINTLSASIPWYQFEFINPSDSFGPVSNTYQNAPDISALASNYEFFINGGVSIRGGTSYAAPVWAGFTALAIQENGPGFKMGFLAPLFYEYLSQPAMYSQTFNDVQCGSNAFGGQSGFTAGPGYDLATGIGTPTCGLLQQLGSVVATQQIDQPPCGYGDLMCPNSLNCCPTGNCETGDKCCPTATGVCGSVCCSASEVCLLGVECCDSANVCGSSCCTAGDSCITTIDGPECYDSTEQTECGSGASLTLCNDLTQVCIDGTCCDNPCGSACCSSTSYCEDATFSECNQCPAATPQALQCVNEGAGFSLTACCAADVENCCNGQCCAPGEECCAVGTPLVFGCYASGTCAP